MPLGVFGEAAYEESSRQLEAGQIIAIGTDGIWEARNGDGRMFGKPALQTLLQEHRERPAIEILSAVMDALQRFVHPLDIQDDATLVIVKVEGR